MEKTIDVVVSPKEGTAEVAPAAAAPVTVTVIPGQARTYALAKELAQLALAMDDHGDEAVAWRHHAFALAGLAERALLRRIKADRTPEGRERMREAATKAWERRQAAKAPGQNNPKADPTEGMSAAEAVAYAKGVAAAAPPI